MKRKELIKEVKKIVKEEIKLQESWAYNDVYMAYAKLGKIIENAWRQLAKDDPETFSKKTKDKKELTKQFDIMYKKMYEIFN